MKARVRRLRIRLTDRAEEERFRSKALEEASRLGNRAMRRQATRRLERQDRQFRREDARTTRRVLTPVDVPLGSVLAETTANDIAAGRYSVAVYIPPEVSRHETYAEKCSRRHREKRLAEAMG